MTASPENAWRTFLTSGAMVTRGWVTTPAIYYRRIGPHGKSGYILKERQKMTDKNYVHAPCQGQSFFVITQSVWWRYSLKINRANLVPTLRVGTKNGRSASQALHLKHGWQTCYKLRDAERPKLRSHAERGNKEDGDKAISNCTTTAEN